MGTYSEDRVIIFDWDDTLIPSTWLKKNGFIIDSYASEITTEMIRMCKSVEPHVLALLEVAKTYGKVLIVTNGTKSWVEMSTRLFFPNISNIILSLTILSGPDLYDNYTSNPNCWKQYVFQNEVLMYSFPNYSTNQRTIISIGDGYAERLALQSVMTRDTVCSILKKSVKFMEQSSPTLLIEQLVCTLIELKGIIESLEPMDHQWEFLESPVSPKLQTYSEIPRISTRVESFTLTDTCQN